MSSSFLPIVFLIVSGWILDVSDSFSTLLRVSREVQGEGIETDGSEKPNHEFHHGSADAALALSSGDGGGEMEGQGQESGADLEDTAFESDGQSGPGSNTSGVSRIDKQALELTLRRLFTIRSSKPKASGGTHGNVEGPEYEAPSGDLSEDSTSSVHSDAVGESEDEMEDETGGQLHHAPSEGPKESPAGVATASGGEQEMLRELLEIWTKIGSPEMLGTIAAMSGNVYVTGTGGPHASPPRVVWFDGAGGMGGNTQSSVTSFAHGAAGYTTVRGIGVGGNTSQAEEVVYVMMVPGYGEMSKGRGGYTTYNTAGIYKMAGASATPGSVTYMAIPVGSVTTRGRSAYGVPMYYGGTARRGGGSYTAWPVKYGAGASRSYSSVAYTAVPVGQVVTTRAQRGYARPAASAQATYYTVQGGRAVATQQRPAAGGSYAAVQAVVVPAQPYKVVSG